MIIVNQATCGEKTYIVSTGTGLVWASLYKVYAQNETEAIDLVANYLENHGCKGLYYSNAEVRTMASVSRFKTADAFAEAHNLTCCGNHGIYIELLKIQEVSK